MTITTILVVGIVLALGIVFFRLHSLPERLGHKKFQFEIVAVLGLLSLFTHVHAFWVAGLLLALDRSSGFPDAAEEDGDFVGETLRHENRGRRGARTRA